MDETVKRQLESLGMDVPETLSRFMDREELLLKYVKKFREDDNAARLQTALKEKDYKEAFVYAHTLKGVAANLGLGDLYAQAAKLADLLRNPPYEEDGISSVGSRVAEEVNRILAVTQTW